MSKFRKIIYAPIVGVFLMWLITSIWLDLSYASSLPETPDVKNGRVYRMMVEHGQIRYGTEQEIRTIRWVKNLEPVVIIGVLMVVIVGFRYGDFKIGPGRKFNE